jgi:hypothetical protein
MFLMMLDLWDCSLYGDCIPLLIVQRSKWLISIFSPILFQESLVTERDNFYETALSYVFKLQEVNEKKKFEFVETVRLIHCYRRNVATVVILAAL